MGFITVAIAVAATLLVAAVVDALTSSSSNGSKNDDACMESLRSCEEKNLIHADTLNKIATTNSNLAIAVANCEGGRDIRVCRFAA